MLIGVPTEIKNNEFRVAITPVGVNELTNRGHEVMVQAGAGLGSSITDEEYQNAGATIIPTAEEVWTKAEMIIKVKEPIASEYELMQEGQILFTYLHLAADKPLTDALIERKVTSIAYETVQLPDRSLPLLAPMSEVAGRLSAQVAANLMMKNNGGGGVLFGGTTGTRPANVVVLGGGTVGFESARIISGMGARVTVFDINIPRMSYIEHVTNGRVQTQYSAELAVREALKDADAVIGSVLVPGARTPHLVTNDMVAEMKPGSALVDVAIDQGGCFEDSHPTTHDDPTFQVHNSVFYCVANMPGAVPNTATYGLTNATMRYCIEIANNGWKAACQRRPELAKGLTTHDGKVYVAAVSDAFDLPHEDVDALLA
ncbi:MAG: alanine dehydrogenase [Trueperella sp.]|nr:alanine dehydrogenase [Trueperella sp.]